MLTKNQYKNLKVGDYIINNNGKIREVKKYSSLGYIYLDRISGFGGDVTVLYHDIYKTHSLYKPSFFDKIKKTFKKYI